MSIGVLRCVLANYSRAGYRIPVLSQSNVKYSINMAQKTALLLIADGSEDIETVTVSDVLRRAKVSVTIASTTGNECVKCSNGLKVCVDAKLEDAVKEKKYDAVILPGGLGGTKAFADSEQVKKVLQEQEKENRLIAAICAAPTALKAHGIAKGKQITSYPAMKDQLVDEYKYLEDIVVVDGNVITSQGPATALPFALAIVEKLVDKNTADTVAKAMLYKQ